MSLGRTGILVFVLVFQVSFTSHARTEDVTKNSDFKSLLAQCSGDDAAANACRDEARIAGQSLQTAGVPVACRGLRAGGGEAYYHCLRQHVGTPPQCRGLRGAGGDPYYHCLRQHVNKDGGRSSDSAPAGGVGRG